MAGPGIPAYLGIATALIGGAVSTGDVGQGQGRHHVAAGHDLVLLTAPCCRDS